ncbi:flagellar biosynthesis regulatory protein FlaF [Fodinicurvata sediminis]|uniref:flagellar biosynthesis regulatory protein FlaF n=1 Tax=Fodinicurvata sediminis TaxID=1121832 RepID=UPI0003B34C00|nr:flagellar biosynthesis regulatory protein FlaF [Fodinicurvata sediminis]
MMQNTQALAVEQADMTDGTEMRAREFQALERVTATLRQARDTGEAAEAERGLAMQKQLWTAFIEDLSAPGNALPAELRQQLTNIGAVVLQNANVANDESIDFDFHINVNEAIMEGLQGG